MDMKKTLVTAMAAALFSTGAPLVAQAGETEKAAKGDKASCKGKDGCKGKAGCKGKNGCQGKGGGKTEEDKK